MNDELKELIKNIHRDIIIGILLFILAFIFIVISYLTPFKISVFFGLWSITTSIAAFVVFVRRFM